MRKRLSKQGIDGCFKVVVTAGDEGAQKPDKEVFLIALRAANLQAVQVRVASCTPQDRWHASSPSPPLTKEKDPSRILYIGDETELDVKGANGVGWTSVLVRHAEKTSNGLARYEIDNLEQLRDIVLPKQSTWRLVSLLRVSPLYLCPPLSHP